MSCTACPPYPNPVARPSRAHLAQSGPIRDLERGHRGPRRSVAPSIASQTSQTRLGYRGPWHGAIASIFSFSILPLSISLYGVYLMSSIVVEPYNWRFVAESSKFMAGLWFAVGFGGVVCSYMNLRRLPAIARVWVSLKDFADRKYPRFMPYLYLVQHLGGYWSFLLFLSKLIWILGPSLMYVLLAFLGQLANLTV